MQKKSNYFLSFLILIESFFSLSYRFSTNCRCGSGFKVNSWHQSNKRERILERGRNKGERESANFKRYFLIFFLLSAKVIILSTIYVCFENKKYKENFFQINCLLPFSVVGTSGFGKFDTFQYGKIVCLCHLRHQYFFKIIFVY